MKPGRKLRRLSTKEILLIASPFPLLWLFLGLTVHKGVFSFWVTGQQMGDLAATTLLFVPIGFAFLYLLCIYVSYTSGKPISASTVIICSLFSFALAWIFQPIP